MLSFDYYFVYLKTKFNNKTMVPKFEEFFSHAYNA